MRPVSTHALQLLISNDAASSTNEPRRKDVPFRRRRTGARIVAVVVFTGAILLALATPLVAVGLG